ncbi:MAG: hypothetical protein WCX63_00990 [Methanoregula sp.]
MVSDLIQQFRDDSDNYDQTVISLISFAHLLRYDNTNGKLKKDSFFFIGRKMDTSDKNRIRPNSFVTPDIVLQDNSQYGIIGEVKKSLPQEKEFWKKTIKQLHKYDDNLIGWKTSDEKINKCDLIFLTDYLLKSQVLEYLSEKKRIGEFSTTNKFSLISFAKLSGSEEKFTFERVCGNFSDERLNNLLKKGSPMPMPLEKVMQYNTNGAIKFYDSKPPLPYLMNILWQFVFPSIRPINQYVDEKGKKQFETNINFLTQELHDKFTHTDDHDSRQPKIPETAWVREAMEEFVRLGYAENKPNEKNSYIVKIRTIKDPFEKFCKEIVKGRSKKRGYVQATIDAFNDKGN